jgi:hypothetical protein
LKSIDKNLLLGLICLIVGGLAVYLRGSGEVIMKGGPGYIIPAVEGTDFNSAATITNLLSGKMAQPTGSTSQYVRGDGSLDVLPTMSNTAAYLTGSAYSLTATSSAVIGGTTNPTVTLPTTGTYLLFPTAQIRYNGATFLASRNVTLKLRKTSGTPADISNSQTIAQTQIITALSFTMATPAMPIVVYSGTAGDVVSIFADVSVLPTLGSIQCTEGSIVAIKMP